MAVQPVCWGEVKKYFLDHGYTVTKRGGDAMIKAPKGQPGVLKNTVRIGHRFSDHAGDRLNDAHVNLIARHFGVTRDDILNHK